MSNVNATGKAFMVDPRKRGVRCAVATFKSLTSDAAPGDMIA
jgi:hypothetical protein